MTTLMTQRQKCGLAMSDYHAFSTLVTSALQLAVDDDDDDITFNKEWVTPCLLVDFSYPKLNESTSNSSSH